MNLEALAWYDPETCAVKVRVLYKEKGKKRGCIIQITEELLFHIGEGERFPYITPTSDGIKPFDPENPKDESPGRWRSIVEET